MEYCYLERKTMLINGIEYELKPLEEGDEDLIEGKVGEYDHSVALPVPGAEEETLYFKITDGDGRIIAGCILAIDTWKVADLDILWVDEKYRRKGLGSALIKEAERTAREKGCDLMTLGTFDFQARPLYEKHGYKLCGVIEDWPKGHCNYSLSKRLDLPSKEYVPSRPEGIMECEIHTGTKEDGDVILKGLGDYNDAQYPSGDDNDEQLGRKITDENGNIIAGYIAGYSPWGNAYVDIWIDEPHRNKGLGEYFLKKAEQDTKEKGALFMLLGTFDWQRDYFVKHGYKICTRTEDNPKGHSYSILTKNLY